MPQPIIPIHQLNNLDSLFNNQSEPENYDHLMGSLSVMQQQLMGGAPQEKTAAKYSDTIVSNLEAIAQEEEDLINNGN